MFEAVLKMVEEKVPDSDAIESLSEEEWDTFVNDCFATLLILDDFLPTLELVLGKGVLLNSVQELISYQNRTTSIAAYRIRPDNDYFITKRRALPSPAHPKGPSATGLLIELEVYTGFDGRIGRVPASIDFIFEVWGHEERQVFKELFTDYRRIVCQLLSGLDLEFSTSRIFPTVESYRKRDVGGKLERYLIEEDGESNFSLRRTYYGDADEREFAKIFMVFLIFYSSCMNRLTKRGNKDIILDYFLKIRS